MEFNYFLGRRFGKTPEFMKKHVPACTKVLDLGVPDMLSEYLSEKYGISSLRNISGIIQEEIPDIYVTSWPNVLGPIFNFRLKRVLKKGRVKKVLREIPFQKPVSDECFSYYKNHLVCDENLKRSNPVGIRFYVWAWVMCYIRKAYYSRVDGVMHYTENNGKIPESYGVNPEKIIVTFNSPDTANLRLVYEKLLKKPGLKEFSEYRLIHVGRLVPWKRVEMLLQATADLSKDFPDTELIVIGRGPEKDRLEHLAMDLKISNRVIFAGDIYEPEALGEYLLSSSVYVLAGMGGLSVNEAMSFGKPIIVSRGDGTERSLVINGKNGLYFEEGNVQDLTEKIRQLFENPELGKSMGNESLRLIRTKVNIDQVSERFRQAFRIISGKIERGNEPIHPR